VFGIVPKLGNGQGEVLSLSVIDKRNGGRYLEADLKDLLIDSAVGYSCHLEATLRYMNAVGARFKRRITYDASLVGVHYEKGTPNDQSRD
jgi:hypothetical protein